MRGWAEGQESARDLATYVAWRTEAFAREDKLKPLAVYLRRDKRSSVFRAGPQTPAEIAASLADRPGAKCEIVDRPRPRRARPSE